MDDDTSGISEGEELLELECIKQNDFGRQRLSWTLRGFLAGGGRGLTLTLCPAPPSHIECDSPESACLDFEALRQNINAPGDS